MLRLLEVVSVVLVVVGLWFVNPWLLAVAVGGVGLVVADRFERKGDE